MNVAVITIKPKDVIVPFGVLFELRKRKADLRVKPKPQPEKEKRNDSINS
jgi:hypothetical protein